MDVAAALAAVQQGDTPRLLDPAAEKPAKEFKERPQRGDRPDRGGRPERGGHREDRGPRRESPARRSDVPMATYRTEVGKRHKVEPRQIVGALANEGGLGRGDFGKIDIRTAPSIVQLPVNLPSVPWASPQCTRSAGQLNDSTNP